MMNKNVNYKRTEGKGYYENKEDKDHKVFVYDITHCVDDENTYYSYCDPMFDIRYLSTAKDKFLDKFVYTGQKVKLSKYINMFSKEDYDG